MRYHRGLIFWGLALVTGGVVALAAQLGYLNPDLLAQAWHLWPLILVAIGLSILLARTPFAVIGTIAAALVVGVAGGALVAVGPGITACGGAEPTNLTSHHGPFGDQARVQIDFNCGTLDVATVDGSGWSVASSDAAATVTDDPNHLTVRNARGDNWFDVGGRQVWNVKLPRATSYQLDVAANAADSTLDLSGGHFRTVSLHPNAGTISLNVTDAQVDNLNLSLNAGSASILVAGGADITGSLHVNAGSIELCTKGAMAFRLTVKDNLTFSNNLDESGLGRDGDTWSLSPPVPSGAVIGFINLTIEGNAGSFDLNPAEGCS